MRFQNLSRWLDWQEKLHFTAVDPGLERVDRVWQQLRGQSKLPFTVITVAGTNGKGSSVAILESILRAAGYRTAAYTSPHLLKYNERICINGDPCDDQMICDAFNRVDVARDQISLTYFEFATLAAVDIFWEQNVDIAILEVGMGGRLDAVNLFDTDIALITPISLDHTTWLGTTREEIGFEKAGILRTEKPVVCSEPNPPQSVLSAVKRLSSPMSLAETDFKFLCEKEGWHWTNKNTEYKNLPFPALTGHYQLQNASAVLQLIDLLKEQNFSISEANIKAGMVSVQLAGRFQLIAGDVDQIFDVTHNQQGAKNLVELLAEKQCDSRTIAVLGMLKDKDVVAVVKTLMGAIDLWYVAGLSGGRGLSSDDLAKQVEAVVGHDKVIQCIMVGDAYKQASRDAKKGDQLLIFGSFHTVESALRLHNEKLNKDII